MKNITFGAYIKSIRKDFGLTQTEFGKKIGTTKFNVGYIERNLRQLKPSVVVSIADKLGMSRINLVQAYLQHLADSSGIDAIVEVIEK